MAEYYKQIKMQEYNDTYQQAQLDIVLEGQRNLASQAEIMNRLNELQTQIANQAKASASLIPLSKTNAPEAAIPITKISSKVAKKLPTTAEEQKAMQSEDFSRVASKKKTMIKLPPIEKKISPKNTPTQLSPTSTEATFQQSSMRSPEAKTEKKTLTGKTVKEINTEFAKIKSPVKIENFEIRVESGKPIYKDLNSGIDIIKPTAQLVQRLYNQYKIQSGSGIKLKRNAKGQFTKK